MTTTDSNGIIFLEATDPLTPLQVVINALQTGTSTALNATARVFPVADTTARNALSTAYGPTTSKPLYVHRANAGSGRELEYTTDGTIWRTVPATGSTAYAEEIGTASATITTGQSSAAFSIALTAGRFTQTPKIFATVDNASSGAWCASTGTSTTAGAGRIFVAAAVGSNTTIPITWHAIQMTNTSATG